MPKMPRISFLALSLSLSAGAIAFTTVAVFAATVFSSWLIVIPLGIVVGVTVAWLFARAARRARRDADPEEVAKRGSWEPPGV